MWAQPGHQIQIDLGLRCKLHQRHKCALNPTHSNALWKGRRTVGHSKVQERYQKDFKRQFLSSVDLGQCDWKPWIPMSPKCHSFLGLSLQSQRLALWTSNEFPCPPGHKTKPRGWPFHNHLCGSLFKIFQDAWFEGQSWSKRKRISGSDSYACDNMCQPYSVHLPSVDANDAGSLCQTLRLCWPLFCRLTLDS